MSYPILYWLCWPGKRTVIFDLLIPPKLVPNITPIKDKEHMIEELSDFLETDTTSFVEWVMKLYVKLTGMSTAPTGIGEWKILIDYIDIIDFFTLYRFNSKNYSKKAYGLFG